MTVVNIGESPALNISTGESFSIPGVSSVTCTKVTGSDEYSDSGTHLWTVTYEGTDAPSEEQDTEENLPETKYNVAVEGEDEENLIHSGTMQVTLAGDKPSFTIQPGSTFSLPGLGNVTCTKISANDEYTESGLHVWTITYEGSNATEFEQSEALPEIKYNFSIDKDGDNDIHSGTMTVVNIGESPSLNISTGESFSIPGIGNVACTKVTGNDEYTDGGSHIWTVTYEGTDAPSEEQEIEETLPETKYNLSIENNNDSPVHSGTMSVALIGDNPIFDLDVGSTFRLPGLGEVTCTKITASDEHSDSGSHIWTVTYEGSDLEDAEQSSSLPEIKYSFSIDSSSGSDIHSGSMTVVNTGEAPSLAITTGSEFNIPGIGNVTCTKVNGNDEYNDNGSHLWTVTYEGSDAPETETPDEETLPQVKYNFSIEGENEDNLVHSGTVQVVNAGEAPAFDFGIGHEITVPGIGKVKCTKVSGNDEYTDNGSHIWTVTYEGTDASSEEQTTEETLPQVKYSFSIEGKGENPEHTGSMQIVNTGDTPAVTLAVGAEFTIPGAGKVICTKVSGNDEYTDNGTRRWTVTYEGTDKDETSEQAAIENTKYTFSVETSGDVIIHSGTKQVITYGESPTFAHSAGDTFNVPGAGNLTCTKYNGSDEFTDDGLHKWTITYEGTDAPSEEETQSESLPETKYNLAIEKDNDGDIQKSGSMSVVSTGDAPSINVSVGSTFNIPGIGAVTCSKVTANDDYTETGTHRWTMTYEGYTSSSSAGDDDNPDETDTNAKYSFSLEQNSSGNLSHSGTVEISSTGNSPTFIYQVGDTLNLPGIGTVTCVKVSGSDSYTDSGKRKWTVVYEGSDKEQSEEETQATNIKYSVNIENNADGVTVYSGSKEITFQGEAPVPPVSIGGKFTLPLVGELTCTRIHSSNDDANTWAIIIEGSRSGSSSSSGGGDDSSLPETETVINYEINGSTARTIAGEFIALRRSQTPITKKNITVYTNSVEAIASPGSIYDDGIVLSENIVKETIKDNGVVTGSYYKHTIEVES